MSLAISGDVCVACLWTWHKSRSCLSLASISHQMDSVAKSCNFPLFNVAKINPFPSVPSIKSACSVFNHVPILINVMFSFSAILHSHLNPLVSVQNWSAPTLFIFLTVILMSCLSFVLFPRDSSDIQFKHLLLTLWLLLFHFDFLLQQCLCFSNVWLFSL